MKANEKRNGQNYRTVIQMASIDDFSIVVDPAYLGTYVSTREFSAPDEETENNMAARLDVEWAMLEMDFENL